MGKFIKWRGYLVAIGLVALATWLKYLAQPNIIAANIPILYMLAIVPTAIFFGLGPSILVCILSLLAYDFFFIPPVYQITFDVSEVPILVIFLLVGLIISYLASNLREKNRMAAAEIATRKQTEAELANYRDHLEDLVKQRTSELEKANSGLNREIDDRQRIEEALRESEERWATTFGSIGDAVIATDTDGRITHLNAVAETLTGWTLREAKNQHVEDVFNIINEHTRQKVANPVEKVLQQGIICGLANHTILIRKDGTEVAIDDSGSPIRTAEGRTIGVVLVFRDITQRKKMEDNLHDALQRLTAHVENSPLAIVEFDPQYRITRWSAEAQRLFGWTAEEVLGKAIGKFRWVVEEDVDSVDKVSSEMLSGQNPRNLNVNRNYRKDGSIITCEWYNSALLDEHGNLVSVLSQVLDITERKKAEEALSRYKDELEIKIKERTAELAGSEEKYRTLFNSIDEGFCIIEVIFNADNRPTDYRFLEINQAFERQTGLQDAEGKLMRNLAPDHEAHWFEIYGRIALTGQPERFMNEARALNRWYDVYAFRVGAPESRRVAILFSDITQHKKMEKALQEVNETLEQRVAERTAELRETRDYLNNLLDYANAPIIVWDPSFRITQFNHAFEWLTGRTSKEVIGSSLDILFPTDSREHSLEHIRRAVAGERMEVEEIPIQHKDGTVRIVLWNSATLYDRDNKTPTAMIAQGQDITERKKVEEQLRQRAEELETVMNLVPVAIWVAHDPECNNITGNRTANEFYEAKEGENVSAGPASEEPIPPRRFFRNGKELTAEELPMQKAAARNMDIQGSEFNVMLPSGKSRTLWGSASPLRDQDGQLRGVVAAFLDITERKQAEEDMKRYTVELEAANKELEAFSYSVSHDLRAPLRSLDGFSQAVIDEYGDKLDDQGKDYLNRVRKSSQHMSDLINDLLKLSRLSRAEIHFQKCEYKRNCPIDNRRVKEYPTGKKG